MKRMIILLSLVLISCQKEKVKNTFFNECFSSDKAILINKMVYSFENKVCDYYDFQIEDSDKAFKKYIEDFSNNNIDLRKLVSKNELNLLDKSNNDLKEDVWITFKEKIESEDLSNVEDEIEIVTVEGVIDDEIENKYENLLTVNYYGKFAKCLIKNSKDEDFKQMVLALREVVGDISPTIVTYGLKKFDITSFNEYSMRSFIAFELYYATLNMISKN